MTQRRPAQQCVSCKNDPCTPLPGISSLLWWFAQPFGWVFYVWSCRSRPLFVKTNRIWCILWNQHTHIHIQLKHHTQSKSHIYWIHKDNTNNPQFKQVWCREQRLLVIVPHLINGIHRGAVDQHNLRVIALVLCVCARVFVCLPFLLLVCHC